MPSWWRKSSSKVKKKGNKDNLLDALHFGKLKFSSEEKGSFKSSGASRLCSLDTVSENGLGPRADSTSSSPSTWVSRSQRFSERSHGRPLPLLFALPSTLGCTKSEISLFQPSGNRSGRLSPCLPLPSPDQLLSKLDIADIDGGLSPAYVSSVSSVGSDEPANLQQENGLRHANYKHPDTAPAGRVITDGYGGSGVTHAGQSPSLSRKSSKQDILRPGSPFPSHNYLSPSPKRGFFNTEVSTHLQIPVNGAAGSSMSSPSRSPMRVYGFEQSPNSAFWPTKSCPEAAWVDSGHCSSPGSGHNSEHHSMGGDLVGQLFRQQSRGSPECSPIHSPRMTSGPSSRVQSGPVTPLHSQAIGTGPESPTSWPEEGKHLCHRLPRPPLPISNSLPHAMSCSASGTSSTVTRSPGGADNPPSPGSRWKKGKLLGMGTFGHVYAGLNSESGKMCAMKEVTLFADDPKSKESVKQLAQEIALLSRLSHKNIVQYYGSETIDDKLYIYLEYVSGGSIHKLLQEYGQFGEPVIRSYTQQILAGLAYLHSKSTVHRDIKGANVLVDPNGQVKLADFGMAKHITAQSCPLSFKGSPYWMAPEVITNSNGYNLAVDIWSLGCTVLEMATAKPPWSQYEGVAAMFKIGNSKELPTIPNFLSNEGKDFVSYCLQRNPANRPSAAQLLEHPFVKNDAPYVKSDVATQISEVLLLTNNGDRPMNVTQVSGHMRNLSPVDTDCTARQSKGKFAYQSSSELSNVQKNVSLPVSLSGSPLMQSRSPHHRSGMMSPSPISTPLVNSGSSTPLTGGHGAIPFQVNGTLKQNTHTDESFENFPRSPNGPYINGSCLNSPYHGCGQDAYLGINAVQTPEGSATPRDQIAKNSDILGKAFGRMMRESDGELQRQYGGQVALAEHVSQQLLKIPSKLPGIGSRPGSPMIAHANSHGYR